MDKVNLPKSTKKLYYQIFKDINIYDILVFSFFIVLVSVFAFIISMALIWKIIISVLIIVIGLISVQKNRNDIRVYNLVFRAFKYFAIGFKNSALQIDVKFQNCKQEEIVLFDDGKEKMYIAGIKLQAINLQLLNEIQQQGLIGDFANLIRTINLPCKIIKTNSNYNFDEQIKSFAQFKNEKNIAIKNHLVDLQVEQLQAINNSAELTEPSVYIIWFANKEVIAKNQLTSVQESLNFSNLKYSILDNQKIKKVWNEFCFNQKEVKVSSNNYRNEKKYGFSWAINDLPKQINYFWLNQLFSLNDINVCVNLKTIAKAEAKKRFDSALNKIQTNSDTYARTESQKSQAQQYYDAFISQQKSVIEDLDILKEISIFIFSFNDKKNLVNIKRELNNLALINGWKYDHLNFLQLQGLLAIYSWNNLIAKDSEIEMTCDTFATSFPISDIPLNDKKGFLLAQTTSGKPIIWDLFTKNYQRVNHNLLILGESGSGKSFCAKKILTNLSYQDTKVFIIDPEREYDRLTENLEGSWVDMAGCKNSYINPLEIYKINEDEDNSDTFNNQLSLLENFFILLFPKLNEDDQVLTLLIDSIKETYMLKNIYPSTNFEQLKTTDFPIFSDVYNLVNEKIKNIESRETLFLYENVKSKLLSLTQGSYNKYWNGYSNFNWKSNFTCFDLQTLTTSGNQKIINIQMLLLLRLLNQQMIVNKINNEKNNTNQKIVIIVDEAHLLLNDNTSYALDFLASTAKRIRKYQGSLIVISQNINDFSGTVENKKKFTAVIDNCQYWLVGGMQPNDLNELDKMYQQSGGLSNAVKNYIATANRGKFWFKVSKQEQLPIQVLQLEVELDFVEKNNLSE